MSDIIIPGKEHTMRMSLKAFRKIAEFVLKEPMKPKDTFTIKGTDGKSLLILLEE